MDKEDIIMNAIFLSVVIASFALSFHMVNRGIEIDTTPLYWPETFPPDPEPDWEDSDDDFNINDDNGGNGVGGNVA